REGVRLYAAVEDLARLLVIADEAVGEAEPVERIRVLGIEGECALEPGEDIVVVFFADPFDAVVEVTQGRNRDREAVLLVDRERLLREGAPLSPRRPLVAEPGAVLATELVYPGTDRERICELRVYFERSREQVIRRAEVAPGLEERARLQVQLVCLDFRRAHGHGRRGLGHSAAQLCPERSDGCSGDFILDGEQ